MQYLKCGAEEALATAVVAVCKAAALALADMQSKVVQLQPVKRFEFVQPVAAVVIQVKATIVDAAHLCVH